MKNWCILKTRSQAISGARLLSMLAICGLSVIALSAQTPSFTVISEFCGEKPCPLGGNPVSSPVQTTNGDLYGTTGGKLATVIAGTQNQQFADNGPGVIFKMKPGNSPSAVYTFCSQSNCTDGRYPFGTLIQATNGDLYGTTVGGGVNGDYGTVFKLTLAGTFTTLYSFCAEANCADGQAPYAGLVQATDGHLYGTTSAGGANGKGTAFKITPDGALTTIYSFCSEANCTDGATPYGGMVQVTDGNLFGTTSAGGRHPVPGELIDANSGTVFKLSLAGKLTTFYSFCFVADIFGNCVDGANPTGSLIQGTDGSLYGTTYNGALGFGSVFKLTLGGKLSTVTGFCGELLKGGACSDLAGGMRPQAGVIQGTDGNFYGSAYTGGSPAGAAGAGTIFQLTPAGKLTPLHTFCTTNCKDGGHPYGGLVQETDGTFYGTTLIDGNKYSSDGTLFSLSTGLGPFIKIQTTSGKAGSTVRILGNDLTVATSVTFNGVVAEFKVNSPSEISATVPAAATSGPVQVFIPGGPLTSNVPFQIR
jgi:uncharacterized repeat protein (TIGR03803 family)